MARIRIDPPPPSSSEYQWSGVQRQDIETKYRQLIDRLLEAAQMGHTHKIEAIMTQMTQSACTPRDKISDPVSFLVANHKTKRGPLRRLVELGYTAHEALVPALTEPDALELVNFLIDELGADPAQISSSKLSLSIMSFDNKNSDPCFGPFWDALAVLINLGYVYRVDDEEKEWLADPKKYRTYFLTPPVKYLINALVVNFSVAAAIADHPEGWDHNILRFLAKTKHALTHDQNEKIAAELVAREMGC
jgi:hypothetical protein